MTHRLKKEVCCVLNFWRPDSNLIISSRLQIIPTFIILSTGCYSTSFVAYYKYKFILRVEDIFIDILCTQLNILSNCRFLYSCKWQIKPFLPNKSNVIYSWFIMLQSQDQQGLRVEDIFIGKLFLCVTFEIHEIENRLSRYVSTRALTLTKTIIFRRYMCDWSLAKIIRNYKLEK